MNQVDRIKRLHGLSYEIGELWSDEKVVKSCDDGALTAGELAHVGSAREGRRSGAEWKQQCFVTFPFGSQVGVAELTQA